MDLLRVTPKSRKIKLSRKKGILFHNPGFGAKTVFYIGTWLFVAGISYGIYLYFPLASAYINYLNYQKVTTSTNYTAKEVEPVAEDYSITIPKLLAFAKIEKNISPYDANQYLKVLSNNEVAQAEGTSEVGKGIGKTTYLFAHSSQEGISMVRNNSVFYLLGQLNNQDIIYINNHGVVLTYQVYKELVINPGQIEYLNYSEPDKEILILQTCWPIGTDWKRLLVFAKRIK